MKKIVWILAFLLVCAVCVEPAFCASTAQESSGTLQRLLVEEPSAIIWADMPEPRAVFPDPFQTYTVKPRRLSKTELTRALEGRSYIGKTGYHTEFDIVPGGQDAYYAFTTRNMPGNRILSNLYAGSPFRPDHHPQEDQIALAEAVAVAFLDALGVEYLYPFYCVARPDAMPQNALLPAHTEAAALGGDGTHGQGQYTDFVVQLAIGGMPLAFGHSKLPYLTSGEKTSDYGAILTLSVDDHQMITHARFDQCYELVSMTPSAPTISWETALDNFAKVFMDAAKLYPDRQSEIVVRAMDAVLFVDAQGQCYPSWCVFWDSALYLLYEEDHDTPFFFESHYHFHGQTGAWINPPA